jgi:tetratricopeptide (TPR) repeat protein
LTGDVGAWRPGWEISPDHTRRMRAFFPVSIRALVENGPDLIERMIPGPALIARAQTQPYGGMALAEKIKALIEQQKSTEGKDRLEQTDLYEQVTRILQVLATRYPLILVIEDIQWADVESINLFYHLCQSLAGSRVLILSAFRPEEVAMGRDGKRHPLLPILSEIQRTWGAIRINLDQSSGMEFVEALLDSEPNHLGPEFRQTLLQHTAGHPLFTIELLRSLQERGDLRHDEAGFWSERESLSWDRLPARVEAVIAERIDRLPLDLRQILEVGSVEGEEFTAEVTAEVLSVEEGMLVRQLSDQLDRTHRLVAATQSLRLDGQRISRYRFQNHLFQTFLYDSLDNVERTFFHERVGLTLERFYQAQPDGINTISVQLARHFQRAGLPLKAIHYLRISGKKSEQLSANTEAIGFYRQALTLCPEIHDALVRAQTELDLTIALSDQFSATVGIASSEVVKLYDRAFQLCQELSEQIKDPQEAAKQLVPTLIGLGGYFVHLTKFQLARKNYDHALALAQASGDPDVLMLSYWGEGVLMVQVGEFSSARSHLEQAFAIYDAHRHQGVYRIFTLDMFVSCASWLAWALFFLGYPDQAQQRSAEAIALARQLGQPFSLFMALVVAALLDCFALDWQGVLDLTEEAIPIGRKCGSAFWLANALSIRGFALAWQGQCEAGMHEIEEGVRVWRTCGDEIGLQDTLIRQAEVWGMAGWAQKGLAALEQPFEKIQLSGEYDLHADEYRIKGDLFLRVSAENQVEAEACYCQAIDIARRQQAKMLELRATTSLSTLLLRQGRREEAREILSSLYAWFTEGFLTKDLQLASRLLQELA